MPPANWLVDDPTAPEQTFPLKLEACDNCANLQLHDCLGADVLYSHYYYVTPESNMLSRHYDWLVRYLFENSYASKESNVVEIGSNRGAFLSRLIPAVKSALGVDPAENVVRLANEHNVPTVCDFFNAESAERIAKERGRQDLIVARHCMAHNEYPQDMLDGVNALLTSDGILVIENNYAGRMVSDVEFDQIYHEHMFYYSLASLTALLERNGLRVIDVQISEVHGGSVLCFATPNTSCRGVSPSVSAFARQEAPSLSKAMLMRFAARALEVRDKLRGTVRSLRGSGKSVAAYGATAKGSTLLNFCGLTARDIAVCGDSTPIKQGRYIPGVGVRIVPEDELLRDPPDYLLLTAWNYKDELIAKVRAMGANDVRFIVPFPDVYVVG
jgi:novobiocin biosynthesis protein NovU/D-mycarose 3-C-methyltransferase